MKYGSKKSDGSVKQEEEKKKYESSKEKERLTVSVIQANKMIAKTKGEMMNLLSFLKQSENDVKSKKDLYSRVQMNERVLTAAINMLDQNKLGFWMIDSE